MPKEFIAHYQITGKLGQGGMGEVYRATDTKLGREVAIKVLPESLADNAERLARFEREAKALAQLNHPQVAAVYDFDQSDGRSFLAMELVEGEDLSTRLRQGALPVEEALDVCKQIAEALEAAHSQGIVHRDLKPANVKLTDEGQVKVLDFGLAKAVDSEVGLASPRAGAAEGDGSRGREPHRSSHRGGHPLDDSPTITADYTLPGTLLGTAAYMSPEQARGKAVDKRSDIWSFGCLLFECLTGKRLFQGEDTTEILASIIKGDPDWSALPENTPPYVHLLLRKCLAKDRRHRMHDMADARIDLAQAIGDPSASVLSSISGISLASERSVRQSSFGMPAMVVAVTLTAIVTWWLSSFWVTDSSSSSFTDSEPRHLKVRVKLDHFVHDHERTRILISPDGGRILYQHDDGSDDIVDGINHGIGFSVQDLDQLKPLLQPLPASFGAKPFWSPDGQRFGYFTERIIGDPRFTDRKLWVVNPSDGEARDIAPMPEKFNWNPWGDGGGAWLPDGRIFFVSGKSEAGAGLWVVSASGGEPEQVEAPGPDELAFKNPSPLPEGRGVLFLVESGTFETDLISVYTGKERIDVFEMPGESFEFAICDPRGYLLFDRATTNPGIWALPFSLAEMKVTGEQPFKVADGTDPSVSEDGTLLYLEGTAAHETKTHQLVWLDDEGNLLEIPGMHSQPMFSSVSLSKDESRALVEVVDEDNRNGPIGIHYLDRPGFYDHVTSPPEGSFDFSPQFHPDRVHVLFRRIEAENKLGSYAKAKLPGAVMKAPLDNSGGSEVVVKDALDYSVSANGRYIVYEVLASDDPTRSEILYLDLTQAGLTPQPLGGSTLGWHKAQISPDGHYIAYLGGDKGARLYLTQFPSTEGRWPVTSDGVSRCFWGKDPDQPTLYYYNRRGSELYRVRIRFSDDGDPPQFDEPEVLFNVNDHGLHHRGLGAPSKDGRRILFPKQTDFGVVSERNVIFEQNWLSRFEDRIKQSEAHSR